MARLDRTIYIDLNVVGNLKLDIDLWLHLDLTAHHDRSKGSGRSSGPIRIDDPHRSDGSYQTDGYLGYNINYSYNTTTSNDIVNAASYISYRPLIHVDVFAVLFMNDLKNLTYVVIGTLGKHVHKQSCSHDFYFI